MGIDQLAVQSNTIKLVKDIKPTNRDSKGRFFAGIEGAFKGNKHLDKSKKKMSESRNKYFKRISKHEYRKYHLGKKQTESTKKKHSILSKKMWSNKEWATEMRLKLNKSHTSKVNTKISQSLKGKPKSPKHNKKVSEAIKKWWANPDNKKKMMGENTYQWKGGVTPLRRQIRHCLKYKEWRISVMIRDNYTCIECGQKGGWLEADHFPKTFAKIFYEYNFKTIQDALNCAILWDINNGRTLCRKDHYKFTYLQII